MNTDTLLVSMEIYLTFFTLFAVMSFQNELITATEGSSTVRDGRGSQMMSDGLTGLFT